LGLSASDVAKGAGELVDIVQGSQTGPEGIAPLVLLISPPPVARLSAFADMFAGSEAKSHLVADLYKQVAAERGCAFFDAGSVIQCSDRDGIHYDPEAHQTLGHSLAGVVQALLQ
jgi:lysophospholipase L1-like esterase